MAIYQSVYSDELNLSRPLVVFDGDCVFCTAGISWIAKKLTPHPPTCPVDGTHAAALDAFETSTGQAAPDRGDLAPHFVALSACPTSIRKIFESVAHPDSIWVWHQGILYDQSDAAFFLIAQMEAPYRLLAVGRVVPRILRDAMYRVVAKYRNKIAR